MSEFKRKQPKRIFSRKRSWRTHVMTVAASAAIVFGAASVALAMLTI
ncbi:hypothetical protein [Aestuariispira insulae]|nr:hypothetical protein [Aestuariispira insulae]